MSEQASEWEFGRASERASEGVPVNKVLFCVTVLVVTTVTSDLSGRLAKACQTTSGRRPASLSTAKLLQPNTVATQ